MDLIAEIETVDHGFLDGRLRILQPRDGYRAATDPVLMAAAMPVKAGAHVLDVGCGVGTAALCLGHRVTDLDLHGIEIQPDYAALARENAHRCGQKIEVHQSDVTDMPDSVRHASFDAVMTNPPWHQALSVASPNPGRDTANRMAEISLTDWVTAASSRVKSGGCFVIIQRVAALPEILAALSPKMGDIAVLPLQSRTDRDAGRVIVKARKSARGPFRLAPPLVLHSGPSHVQDRDDFSPAARAILRDGAALDF
ncbi:MAG: methyltransferase [Pseudomonadota bacterium]